MGGMQVSHSERIARGIHRDWEATKDAKGPKADFWQVLQKHIAPLIAENERLQRDVARLDWLEKNEAYIDYNGGGFNWDEDGSNLRASIDVHMSKERKRHADD